jgi:CheY-like chemotaxis protein
MQADYVWRGSIPIAAPERADARPVVLVVTGDRGLREAAARVFANDGYVALTAAHAGHAVLACLKAGHIDLLVSELSMDDTSGPALAARLRRFCPELATVFLAPSGTPESDGVLVKPFSRLDLLAAGAVARARMALASGLATSAS